MPYTYDTLAADVVANMEEDSAEFVSALPGIIARAQNYLQRRIDSIQINRFTEVSVSASTRTLTLPDDLLVLRSVQVCATGGWSNLLFQTNEFLTAYWPDFTSCGPAKYYAPVDNTKVYLAPTPASDGLALVEYVPRVSILSPTVSSNWFSDYAEDAFFGAAMMYANMWTKNGNATSIWKSNADEEIMALNNEARRSRRSDASDRTGGTPENNLTQTA